MKTYREFSKLVLGFIVMMFSVVALNAETVNIDGINYNINAASQTATVVSGDYTGDIHIVRHITYKSHDIVVTEITSGAFDNTAITSLIVDDSVTIRVLPTGCMQLTHITWPSTATTLSGACNCPLLTQIDIPEGVTNIPTGTFRHATGLKSLTLPSTIERLGILGSEELTEIVISPENDNLVFVDGWVMNADQTILMGGLYSNVMGNSLVFPEGIEEIQCFFSDLSLENLTFPSSLKKMPSFLNCYINTTVRWPEQITVIDKQYFSWYLKGLIIPATVTKIKEYAFGYSNFNGSQSHLRLDNLTFEDGANPLTVGCLFSDYNDDGGLYTFNYLKYLYLGRELNFDPEHTSVDGGSIVFNITDYNIFGQQTPKVYKIGKYIDCDNSHIHKYIGCNNLDTLELHQPIPPEWHASIWNTENFMNITLVVPSGSLQRYQNDEWWGNFWEILEVDCDAFSMGDVNKDSIIDVEDVNSLVNMILKLDNVNRIADMDGNGIIDVEDINVVINKILKL